MSSVSYRPRRPLVVYDGDCGFCRFWIAHWSRRSSDQVDYASYQWVAARFPEIGEAAFARAVHWIDIEGDVLRGAEAVLQLAKVSGTWERYWLKPYRSNGFVRWTIDRLYSVVAYNRQTFSRLTRWWYGEGRFKECVAAAPNDYEAVLAAEGVSLSPRSSSVT